MFPVMEVGGQEKGRAGSKLFDLGGIPWARGDGGSVVAMEEEQKIGYRGLIETDPESQAIRQAAYPGIALQGLPLPACYNKGPDKG